MCLADGVTSKWRTNMKPKKIIIIVCIISVFLMVSGISYNLLIKNNNTKTQDSDKKDKPKKNIKEEKEQAEKIILDSNATIKKDNLEFVSSNGNIYTYNYKVDDSTAIVSYEVDVEKETYTVVIGQLTKSA